MLRLSSERYAVPYDPLNAHVSLIWCGKYEPISNPKCANMERPLKKYKRCAKIMIEQ